MRYQLVLQWPSEALKADLERLIEIEDRLIEKLSPTSCVDGHDVGSGEMNIFILTDDPQSSFEEAKEVLDICDASTFMRAGYREVEGERYTVLWPIGLNHFGVI